LNPVADQLEHIGVVRQGEYRHHHTGNTGSQIKVIVRVRQVVQKVAVEQRLALLLQTDGGVQLGLGLAGQQAGQKVHIGRWRFHIDQKIGASKAEQRGQVVRGVQQGIYIQVSRGAMQNSDRKG